tara:strand:- start:26381 stop:27442 length:1062 start_codon:yes stop_codon:yes gene_type:complete
MSKEDTKRDFLNDEFKKHKLKDNPERVAQWRKEGDCFPLYIEIGATNRCNHQCVFCALDFLENRGLEIDKNVMIRTLEDMASVGVKYTMFAGEGEPLLHKDIGLFVQKANNSGIEVSITTNGVPFNQKKREECLPYLSWIRFSIDSGSSENYSQIHKTQESDFEKVLGNIKQAVTYREKNGLDVGICAQFLMIPQNMGEVGKLAGRLKDIGADHLQIKPYSHHPQSDNNLVVNSGEYNKIEEQFKGFNSDEFHIKFRRSAIEGLQEPRNYSQCHALPFFALTDAMGDVWPCNLFYGDKKFSYGNLNNELFSEIWKGDKRKGIMEKLSNIEIENCRGGCRLDSWNRYLVETIKK